MNEKTRRKELLAQHQQSRPDAGVYRIVNSRNDTALLGSTSNLANVRNKLEFARIAGTPNVLDHRLGKEIREFGIDSLSMEVLESVVIHPEMTPAEIADELATLKMLWREKLGLQTS